MYIYTYICTTEAGCLDIPFKMKSRYNHNYIIRLLLIIVMKTIYSHYSQCKLKTQNLSFY